MSKKALFSLYDTNRVEEFAEALIKSGWEIIASRETVEILSKKKLPVTDIADFTDVREDYGFPPTLHPKVEWYLTSNNEKERIDLVYVINYPLPVGNDIGGRTLLALAAKGNRIPVMSIEDMAIVVAELNNNQHISQDLHLRLLDKANALISRHYFDLIKEKQIYDAIFGDFKYNLMNGENPYQIPAELFSNEDSDALSLANFKQLSGEVPCFTNLADSDCIIQTMCLCSEAFKLRYKKIPYICIAAKHGNPCGMAIDWNKPEVAVHKALFANARAIWGGEVITNFEIDGVVANLLFKSNGREKLIGDSSWMLDVILAPHFTNESIETLGKRKQRKLFENPALFSPFLPQSRWIYRFARGAFLRQPPPNYVLDLATAELVGQSLPDKVIDSVIIAWSVAFSSNHGGNEVALTKDASFVSCGGGPSTVEAVQLTITKANNLGHTLKDAVFAADAFFPFTDAPELLIKSGIRAGVVPSGGKAVDKIRYLFKASGINVFYLPEQYRGFCRH